jgi:hypothetical protein
VTIHSARVGDPLVTGRMPTSGIPCQLRRGRWLAVSFLPNGHLVQTGIFEPHGRAKAFFRPPSEGRAVVVVAFRHDGRLSKRQRVHTGKRERKTRARRCRARLVRRCPSRSSVTRRSAKDEKKIWNPSAGDILPRRGRLALKWGGGCSTIPLRLIVLNGCMPQKGSSRLRPCGNGRCV